MSALAILALLAAVAVGLSAAAWLGRALPTAWRWALSGVVVAAIVVLLLPQSVFVELVRAGRSVAPVVGTLLGHPAADLVVHFLIFLVAGLPFARLAREIGVWLPLSVLLVLAVALEVLQLFVAGHQVHLIDGVMNVAGAATGFLIGLAMFGRGRQDLAG